MDRYYSEKLAAERLERCYALAPPRIQQYLRAEIEFVDSLLKKGDRALELGCGYGRVLSGLKTPDVELWGIDTSTVSLKLAASRLGGRVHLAAMDATSLALPAESFDLVFCIQNGMSAFHVDHRTLFAEAVRVTRRGGAALFSTYTTAVWSERLKWFELQAEAGLLGEIDYEKTGDGQIVCKDGFRGTTISPEQLREWSVQLPASISIFEVDSSSLFLRLLKE